MIRYLLRGETGLPERDITVAITTVQVRIHVSFYSSSSAWDVRADDEVLRMHILFPLQQRYMVVLSRSESVHYLDKCGPALS